MPKQETISICRSNGRDLKLDLFRPESMSVGAAVILLHGGAWMFGDRKEMADYASALAAQGFLAIAAEYRLLGEAAWPAQINDVRDVIAWVGENAAPLEISPAKIALQGFSAGGHLALLAAGLGSYHPTDAAVDLGVMPVAAVVALFAPPVLNLPPPGSMAEAGPNPVASLLGADATEATARLASPLSYVSPHFPPTFLLSGTRDSLVPHQAILQFFMALVESGAPVELHLYQGHAHEFSRLPSMLAPVQAEVGLFLNRVMVDPEHYAAENAALNPFAGSGPPGMPLPAKAPGV